MHSTLLRHAAAQPAEPGLAAGSHGGSAQAAGFDARILTFDSPVANAHETRVRPEAADGFRQTCRHARDSIFSNVDFQ